MKKKRNEEGKMIVCKNGYTDTFIYVTNVSFGVNSEIVTVFWTFI